jgi:hypothetical protein
VLGVIRRLQRASVVRAVIGSIVGVESEDKRLLADISRFDYDYSLLILWMELFAKKTTQDLRMVVGTLGLRGPSSL